MLTALAFTVSHSPGAGERGRLSHHCTTEFTDVTQGQGEPVLARESSSRAQGFGARLDPSRVHAGLGIIHSPAHTVASQGSLKSLELHLLSFHLHGGPALTRVGGRPAERAGRAPRSAPLRVRHPTPRRESRASVATTNKQPALTGIN